MAKSKSFYITNNDKQVADVNKYLYDSKIFNKPDLTPILSERHLAVLLWVLAGGKGNDVSSRALISNCSHAMDMNKEAFKQFSKFINDIPSEDIALYEDIINDRAIYCLMDEVGGDFERITAENAQPILGAALKKYAASITESANKENEELASRNIDLKTELDEIKRKHLLALNEIKRKAIKEIKINKTIKNPVIEDRNQDSSIYGSNHDSVIHNPKITPSESFAVERKNLEIEKDKLDSQIKNQDELATKISKYAKNIVTIFISIIFCYLLFTLSKSVSKGVVDNDYVTIKPKVLDMIPYFISLCTFWKVPELLFKKPIKYIEKKVYNFFLFHLNKMVN